MAMHHCSQCDLSFKVSSKNRLVNKLHYIFYPFRSAETSLEKFSWVHCPRCGKEERDESIRFLGLFPPRVGIIVMIVVALFVAIVDAILRN